MLERLDRVGFPARAIIERRTETRTATGDVSDSWTLIFHVNARVADYGQTREAEIRRPDDTIITAQKVADLDGAYEIAEDDRFTLEDGGEQFDIVRVRRASADGRTVLDMLRRA